MSANVGEAPTGAKDSGNTAVYWVGPTASRPRVEGRMEQGITSAPRTSRRRAVLPWPSGYLLLLG